MEYSKIKKTVVGPLALAILGCGLVACGGGSASGEPDQPVVEPAAENTSLTIGITDAEGDFIQYEVAVDSLQLVNLAGDEISVLPNSARIDFAQYTDVTEILSVASVPVGVYTKAIANLNFADANIVTQDAEGNLLAATAIDAQNNPLGEVSVAIDLAGFGDDRGLRLRTGMPARFTLDFDLDASNVVVTDDAGTPEDVTDDTATTEVAAVWVAEPLLDAARDHRIRGLLQSVNEADASMTLAIRPFHLRDGAFGEITLAVAEDAAYEIDQQSYSGAEGLTALAAMAADTPLVAHGHFVEADARVVVDTVYAGSSVPWAGGEFIKGVVTARSGNQVTVQGVRFTPDDMSVEVSPELMFTLTDSTNISRPGAMDMLDSSAVSIGQRVRVYDEVAGDGVQASHVGLLKNQLRAKVTEVSNGILVSELSLFNGRRPAAYQWVDSEADAALYRIYENGLPHTLAAGDYLKARGWVTPYDFSASAAINPWDFEATTLIDLQVANRGAGLHLSWDKASSGLLESSAESIALSVTESDKGLVSFAGFREPLAGTERLTIAPAGAPNALYSLVVKGSESVQVFLNFAEFSSALNEQATAGLQLARLSASGRWEPETDTFTAARLVVVVAGPDA
ncbi:DUF4382 domain-containing protein [Simiduia sp. 21SJ11W-1]|uniref:DUF4382 domain-containing protein n=1 Tax=Simiduia sp. 21SJ11W-1 TaxID=2909669 RepID=UPI0020A06400|nr:DUF4382 domain-containing protein [Simiduia sp. 21SJ11W-1]UTA47128.1 DUF4382 domain-containing protein [Simiduia sp. 21SJ11W-1]